MASVADPVVVVDARGHLVFDNEAARRTLLLPATEETPLDGYSARYPDGRRIPPEATPLSRALRGEVVVEETLLVARPDGGDRLVSSSASPIRNEQGDVVGAVSIIRASGDQVEAGAIRQANEMLLSSALAAKDVAEREQALRGELQRQVRERERLTAQLSQQTQFLGAILSTSPDPIFVYDSRGRYTYASLAGAQAFGLQPSQMVGKTWLELGLPAKVMEPFEAQRRAVFATGQPVKGEAGIPGVRGLRYFEYILSPVQGADRTVGAIVATLRDVTERKRAEQALRESEAILAQAEYMAHLGAWVIELSNPDNVNANPLRWSDEVYHIFGYEPGSVAVTNELFFERVHPDDRHLVSGAVARAIAEKRPYSVEHRIVRPDGTERTLWEHAEVTFGEHGRPLRIVGAVQDITERKQAERERERLLAEVQLRAAELNTIVESIADAVFVCDARGNIALANSAGRALLGREHGEVLGTLADYLSSLQLRVPDGRPVRLDDLSIIRALRYGDVERGREEVGTHPRTQKQIGLLISAAPLRDQTGNIIGAVEVAADITRLRELQERQREFVSLISHDLRSPLSSVMGRAQLLQREFEQEGKEHPVSSVAAIVKSAKRMSVMIDDLVESARLEAGQLEMHKEAVDLLQLVSDLVERTGSPEDRQRIKVEVAEYVPPVLVDPRRLERAITNLLSNALKYSPAGKPVTLCIRRGDEQAIVAVSDQGVGIPPEDLPHLFQRHFRARTAGKREGLGLGLYITRLIVEANGGRVSVESKVGKGSTFYFTLPLA